MCGIVGYIGPSQRVSVANMNDMLQHRGPDSQGLWHEGSTWLGHRRLSLIDLSETGAQPMISHNERFVMVYNGEVYNFAELRALMPAVSWRGHSDTEIVLEAISRLGLDTTLKHLNGMFAFAVFDRSTQEVTLVRDQVGIKPLHWRMHPEGGLMWASELKALVHGDEPLNHQGLSSYWRYGYIPAPHTAYKGIYKLRPGHVLRYTLGTDHPDISMYWHIHDRPRSPLGDAQLFHVLQSSIKRTMVADVPVGSLLSGGIDSSLVTALMQPLASSPVKTFTIGFEDSDYNEAPYAKAIAQFLGTEHHEMYVSTKQTQAVIPTLPHMYDEPFADSSAIPTFLVFQLASQHVKTVLSGDGGDELWCGYKRYKLFQHIWRGNQWGGKALAWGIKALPASMWDNLFAVLPRSLRGQNPGRRLHTLAGFLNQKDVRSLYQALLTLWPTEAELPSARDNLSLLDQLRHMDIQSYLPDDILTKVDRASMAVSIEARVPLLDRTMLEQNWPQGFGKHELKRALSRLVPNHLFERPKMGFGIPLGSWLRKDLRDWAEDLLQESELVYTPNPKDVRALWHAHLQEQVDGSALLWTVLMFQAWQKNIKLHASSKNDSAP